MNKTKFKTLDIVGKDPRVAEVFQDSDGIWLWLKRGWTCDPRGAHDAREDTVKGIMRRYLEIEACDCNECKECPK